MTGCLRAALAAGLLAASALAGCAPTPLAGSSSAFVPPSLRPAPPVVAQASGDGVSALANLPGWAEEDHAAALASLQAGCPAAAQPAMAAVCARARVLRHADDRTARLFLEANFHPVVLSGPGLLTAYFAPEYPARSAPSGAFTAALRGRPTDLIAAAPDSEATGGRRVARQLGDDGETWPYPDRAGIELTPAVDALAYLRPEDLFFLQIQGSGVLVFPDGRRLKASYAADNGRPFVPIASAMMRRGLLAPNHASGDAIRVWLHAHAGAEAQSVMDLDPRYVFFSLAADDGREPAGAAGMPLTAGRAIAVDPAWHAYGEPYWIDAAAPTLQGAVRRYRRFVMAMDTGSAIRGDVRADLYLGRGEQAGLEAGRVRHTLLLVKLVPVVQAATASTEAGHEATASAGGG